MNPRMHDLSRAELRDLRLRAYRGELPSAELTVALLEALEDAAGAADCTSSSLPDEVMDLVKERENSHEQEREREKDHREELRERDAEHAEEIRKLRTEHEEGINDRDAQIVELEARLIAVHVGTEVRDVL